MRQSNQLNKLSQLSLALLLVTGLCGTAQAQFTDHPVQMANQTLTGRPDRDSHPGPGDTDINNDGKNDLQQIQSEASKLGNTLDRETQKVGRQTEAQLDKLGNEARGVAADLDDADVMGTPVTTWLIVAAVILMLAALVFAATRRRRTVYYR